jgi:hypothetical protein
MVLVQAMDFSENRRLALSDGFSEKAITDRRRP